tara:strand:- start:381 stop:1028 length:648 start_codon:yes stop_codon:yes gene_type:complete
MKKYTNTQLEENYNKFIKAVESLFTGERLEKLLHMYSMDELGPNLMLQPASSNIGYHNAYDGGYIDHIMNVVNNSIRMMKLYEDVGGKIDFTRDELLFAAFHHDLGKLGKKGVLNYLPNPSEWHIKNQGKIYTNNPDLPYMDLTDRTFLTLSDYGLKHTTNEWFGIRLTDGMYDEANIKYLKTFNPDNTLRSNIQYILHWADHMSTCMERDTQNG